MKSKGKVRYFGLLHILSSCGAILFSFIPSFQSCICITRYNVVTFVMLILCYAGPRRILENDA